MPQLMEEDSRFYVAFELRPVEDRDATIKTGIPAFKDQEIAVITMPGGRLVVDKIVNDNLLNEWKFGNSLKPKAQFAIDAYEAWKDGREAPVDGTDLRNWPGVTPAQLKTCLSATVRSVEDLAAANDDTMRRLGMGAVALKTKASTYLKNADVNKNAEEITALKVLVESLQEQVKTQIAQIDELTAPEEPKKRGPGRPKKED